MSKLRLYGSTSGYNELTVPAVADNSEINLGNFVSNNYFEEEKATLGSFADMSDYNLSSLGGSLIYAGSNTYTIPSTASAVYIWAQGKGGNGGSATGSDGSGLRIGGPGGGGSCAVTKITIGHQPHTSLTSLYCELNPQGDAVVYIGTSNSGVEIARGYKGSDGRSVSTFQDATGQGGVRMASVSCSTATSTSTSSYTTTPVVANTEVNALGALFPKFPGAVRGIGQMADNASPDNSTTEDKVTILQNEGGSGGGIFMPGGIKWYASDDETSGNLDGQDATEYQWAFGTGGTGGRTYNTAETRSGGPGANACVVIIVR